MPSTLHSKAQVIAHTDTKALHPNPINKNPSNATASVKFQVFN
jgi:hypothetical protein